MSQGDQGPPGPEPDARVKQRIVRQDSLDKIIQQKRNASPFSSVVNGKVVVNFQKVNIRSVGRGR